MQTIQFANGDTMPAFGLGTWKSEPGEVGADLALAFADGLVTREQPPYLQQDRLLEFCRAEGVALTTSSPLGFRDRPDRLRQADEPVLLEDPTIAPIAARHLDGGIWAIAGGPYTVAGLWNE